MKETISELLEELSEFSGREEALRKIKRWGGWAPMYYRSSDFSHSKRVGWLVAHIAPVLAQAFGENFNIHKAIALAFVHDDPEIVTGDYPAGDKAKMTPEQLKEIDRLERDAIQKLSAQFPKTLGGFSYAELQNDVQDLRTPEALIAKYMDVIDGYGEGIHELYAGNLTFTHHIVNEFGLIPLFDNLNFERRRDMMQRHPELAALKDKHIFFELARPLMWKETIRGRTLHTAESVLHDVGYPQYDEWKKVVLASGDSEEIKNLYTQQEFLES